MRRALLACMMLLCSAPPLWAVPKVQEVTADNGLRAWFIEDHSLPVVTVKIEFEDSGSAFDPPGKEGLASFAMQMIDEGAGDMDSLAYHRALEDHSIHLGMDNGEDTLSFSVQTLSEFKKDALSLLTAALARPRFDAEAIERIRASIISDLAELNENPVYLASLKWKEAAFAGHPYQHPRRGTAQSVASITREDLQSFATTHYICSPKIVAVVGDITADEIRAWLQTLPKSNCAMLPSPPANAAIPDGAATPIQVQDPVPQTVVEASLPGVKRDDPRFYGFYVLNHILGGNDLTSRLGREIRDKRGLAYYAGSDVNVFDHAAYLGLRFATRKAEADEALSIFRQTLADIARNGVTKEELADAKSYLTGSFPLQIDTEAALTGYLVSMRHFNLGQDYLEKRNGLIEAVTLKEVNGLAKTLLSHAPLIVMVGDFTPPKK